MSEKKILLTKLQGGGEVEVKFVYISLQQYDKFTSPTMMKAFAMNAPADAILKCSKSETFKTLYDNNRFPKIAWYWHEYHKYLGNNQYAEDGTFNTLSKPADQSGGISCPVYKMNNLDEKPSVLNIKDYPTEGLIIVAITKDH